MECSRSPLGSVLLIHLQGRVMGNLECFGCFSAFCILYVMLFWLSLQESETLSMSAMESFIDKQTKLLEMQPGEAPEIDPEHVPKRHVDDYLSDAAVPAQDLSNGDPSEWQDLRFLPDWCDFSGLPFLPHTERLLFDFLSGHVPELWTRFLVGGIREATHHFSWPIVLSSVLLSKPQLNPELEVLCWVLGYKEEYSSVPRAELSGRTEHKVREFQSNKTRSILTIQLTSLKCLWCALACVWTAPFSCSLRACGTTFLVGPSSVPFVGSLISLPELSFWLSVVTLHTSPGRSHL